MAKNMRDAGDSSAIHPKCRKFLTVLRNESNHKVGERRFIYFMQLAAILFSLFLG